MRKCVVVWAVAAVVLSVGIVQQGFSDIGTRKADLVLGKPDMRTRYSGPSSIMKQPEGGVAVDPTTQRVYVVETHNQRVIFWNNIQSLNNGREPDGVLGQQDLYGIVYSSVASASRLNGPEGIAVDGSGNVWVCDRANNRVLRYNAPVTSGMEASIVLGQQNSTGNAPNDSNGDGQMDQEPTAATLFCPDGIALDASGNLWVADSQNNRLLRYDGTFETGMDASVVIGQTGFSTNAAATSRGGLSMPRALSLDHAGNLWVADVYNHRALRFDAPFTGVKEASIVLGAPDYTSVSDSNNVSAQTLGLASGISVDGSSNVWVADPERNRIVRFSPPFSDGMAANGVLGQVDLDHAVINDADGNFSEDATPSDVTLHYPTDVLYDSHGFIWAIDAQNHRVLRYPAGVADHGPATLVLLQSNFTSAEQGISVDGTMLGYPEGVTIDPLTGRCYVVDTEYNRVLWWNSIRDLVDNGKSADGVLGQDSLTSIDAGNGNGIVNVSAYRLNRPARAAVDGNGNVWVCDTNNNRVVGYLAPVTNAMPADIVIGQRSFSQGMPNDANGDNLEDAQPSANTLWSPEGIAADDDGRIWVADSGNNRVLCFAPPFNGNINAVRVLGQKDFTSNLVNQQMADGGVSHVTVKGRVGGFLRQVKGLFKGESTHSFPAPRADTLARPVAVACGGNGEVWVADSMNSRVVRFQPTADGVAADMVVGQHTFTSNRINQVSPIEKYGSAVASPAADTLFGPEGISLDASGSLWVADYYNNRVLKFEAPFSNGLSAAVLLGQVSFSSTVPGDGKEAAVTDETLAGPGAVACDPYGNLWVADSECGRVLMYKKTVPLATQQIPAGSSATVTAAVGGVAMEMNIPANAFTETVNLEVAYVSMPGSADNRVQVTPIALQITNDRNLQPQSPITISISYPAGALNGLNLAQLTFALYNPSTASWTPVPTTIDPVARTIVATIKHFSVYALIQLAPPGAGSGRLFAYPVPFDPRKAAAMTITGLSASASTVKIYTVTGELVRTLDAVGGQTSWNGKNEAGNDVASGVYLLLVDSSEGKKKLKVAVQR